MCIRDRCKFHLWEFNLEDACAVENTDIKVKTFNLEVSKGDVLIDI